MKEFLTFIQKVEEVSTPAEFETFMSGRFQEYRATDTAPTLQSTWNGSSPYELFIVEGSPWKQAPMQGFHNSVHMREIGWHDILAACLLVGPRELETGPQALEQEFIAWNLVYDIDEGQVAIITAFMADRGVSSSKSRTILSPR